MAQMSITNGTGYFNPFHAQRSISFGGYVSLSVDIIKTRPAASGIVLGFRIK
jgi:hypothetical protein